jgi:hypothetical protein
MKRKMAKYRKILVRRVKRQFVLKCTSPKKSMLEESNVNKFEKFLQVQKNSCQKSQEKLGFELRLGADWDSGRKKLEVYLIKL